MAERVTSQMIREAMVKRYPAGEYALLWEVADGTGSNIRRYADAMIMSLWPSRGLELSGVEIKVSRSDWKREAADPTKAEAIGQFCDRWWVVTGPGVVHDVGELPPLWGWQEFDGKRWKVHKLPERRAEVAPMSRKMLAAILRRSDEGRRKDIDDHARASIQAAREAIDKRVADQVEARTRGHESLAKHVADFEEASGLKIATGWEGGRALGEAVLAFKKLRLHGAYGSMTHTADQIEAAAKSIRDFVNSMREAGADGVAQ